MIYHKALQIIVLTQVFMELFSLHVIKIMEGAGTYYTAV
jgi:hypothetical protein